MTDQLLAELIHEHRYLLTDRQKFVIHLAACGWSSRRIGNQLNCSHTTVLADLDRALATIRKAAA